MRVRWTHVFIILLTFQGAYAQESAPPAERKAAYVETVTRGGGLMPWQTPGVSSREAAFRASIEARKDALLAARVPLRHPVMVDAVALERVRHRIETTPGGAQWFARTQAQADDLVSKPEGFVEAMIPELTPGNSYGLTCPHCVGVKSQEAAGNSLFRWSSDRPDELVCTKCGQRYPDPQYPETATLDAPRMGQVFTFYLNPAEGDHPEDRSGKYAWHWVDHPMHMSFTGVIRERKVQFMLGALQPLALAYWITGDPRYGATGVAVLQRFAHCYRQWLYHDYWDTIADCDPLYAAWHDRELPIEWKRHLCAEVFTKDRLEKARMEQTYWGAGRVATSTDAISGLSEVAFAYDLLYDARDGQGNPLWTPASRALVERDFFLEYVMGAEPYVGGAGKAECVNNKSPRIYNAFGAVGKCLGLSEYVDTALTGYENVRDESFLYDGFSKESPAYTNMYLSQLIAIPDTLHGFQWPQGYPGRKGTVDYFQTDPRLRLMFQAVVDQLHPQGRYLPLSDTNVRTAPSRYIVEVGARRYPEVYAGLLHERYDEAKLTDYAMLNLSGEALEASPRPSPPEILFPAWMTAILRHGEGPGATVLSLAFSPPGGHRHNDNLALYYAKGDTTYLGDHGYVGDMPVNKWIKSTRSHNLVVVDDQDQPLDGRVPALLQMAATPRLSLVEAAATVYPQCPEYRRLVVLLKGPGDKTVAVDIFRVKGGRTHRYRTFSEIASSDAPEGKIEFEGLDVPPEPPLPEVGSSLAPQDIYGLRDLRTVASAPDSWRARWHEPGRAFRMWMLSKCTRVEASNGPGQETLDEAGRRVRYVDAVNEGDNLASTYVAVLEPMEDNGKPRVLSAARLVPPAGAGPDAVAVRLQTTWGAYTLFNAFAQPETLGDVRFCGDTGVVFEDGDSSPWLWSLGASTFMAGGRGFADRNAHWTGRVSHVDATGIATSTAMPVDWPEPVRDATAYVRLYDGTYWTGLPVAGRGANRIDTARFSPPDAVEFDAPALRFIAKENR